MNVITFILISIILKIESLGRGIAVATCSVNYYSKRSWVFGCMKSNVTCEFANRLIKNMFITIIVC